MKRFGKFMLALLLAAAMVCGMLTPAFAGTPAEDAHLHFNADGKFRILIFSDLYTWGDNTFVEQAVNDAQPDLVVLNGDNLALGFMIGIADDSLSFVGRLMNIFESADVPVAIVFGDRDGQSSEIKERQMQIFNRYSVSVSCDEGSGISGCGTYNVPIYGSGETDKVKFNLWMFDTHKDSANDDCGYVHEDQLDWYTAKSNELKEANGGQSVPSIAFQHIIVNDIYDALREVPAGTADAVSHNGSYYVLPDTAAPDSALHEAPSPSGSAEETEFSVLKQQGDVLAIVSGHNRSNSFVVPYQGIDLINTPEAYTLGCDDSVRGARIIDLDEQGTYTTEMLYPYTRLRFNEDGKFRILNFSDFQDDESLDPRTKTFIRQAVCTAQPDLIVLTGDNIYGPSIPEYKGKDEYSGEGVQIAIAQFMDVFESLGVPVAIVCGNHDDDKCVVSKEEQMQMYNAYSVSVSHDEGDAMEGCGTYNLPIFGSTETDKVKFNLWMFDTGSQINYPLTSHFDYMRENQLDWYAAKSDELKAANGGKVVPSIAFQHIIVNDIYDALKPVSSGGIEYRNRHYVLPDTAAPGSVMREHPSPSSSSNEREFSVIQQQGDVLAIVSGHDHQNMFVVPYQGVDLINTPAAGYYVFHNPIDENYHGDDDTRGARIIDIDESGTYSTEMLFLQDFLYPQPQDRQYYVPTGAANKYVKNIALCVADSAQYGGSTEAAMAAAYRRLYTAVDAAHGNGVARWADLNGGSDILNASPGSHTAICMGYTLTDNPDEAMRSLGLCYNEEYPSKYDDETTADNRVWNLCCYHDLAVSGTNSSAAACNLNAGTKGNPIYFLASYGSSGSPLTQIQIVNTGFNEIRLSDYPNDQLAYARFGSETGPDIADLNKSAWGEFIYALYRTSANSLARVELETLPLLEAYFNANRRLKSSKAIYSAKSLAALQSALAHADAILRDLDDDHETTVYDQTALDAAAYQIVNCMLNLKSTTFTVTFDANGGTCDESSRTIVSGDFCGELPTARKVAVRLEDVTHFDGWYTERTGGKKITPETIFTAASDQTWYAHWSIGFSRIPGDINCSQALDLRDVVAAERYLVDGPPAYQDAQKFRPENADVDGDGELKLRDVMLMRRYLAGGWGVVLL